MIGYRSGEDAPMRLFWRKRRTSFDASQRVGAYWGPSHPLHAPFSQDNPHYAPKVDTAFEISLVKVR